MEQATKIEVNTMITQELRDMLRMGVMPKVTRDNSPTKDETLSSDKAVRKPPPSFAKLETKRTLLRRDGCRPLDFKGSLLCEIVGSLSKDEHVFDHTLSLFAKHDRTLVVALALSPKTNAPLRPSYWAQDIPDLQTFENVLGRWCREVISTIAKTDPFSRLPDTSTAIQTLTAQSLRLEKLLTKRKEPCLL